MKKLYKRNCWYIVDGWICHGYMDKYGFHLTEEHWEEAAYKIPWKVKKKDIFYDFDEATEIFKSRYGYRRLMQYFKDVEADYLPYGNK